VPEILSESFAKYKVDMTCLSHLPRRGSLLHVVISHGILPLGTRLGTIATKYRPTTEICQHLRVNVREQQIRLTLCQWN